MAERPIDIIYGTKAATPADRKESPLDVLERERAQRLLNESRERTIQKTKLLDEKDILQTEREIDDLRRGLNRGSTDQSISPELALVKDLVKEGMEIGKATEMINKMTPSQRMGLWSIASQRGGSQFLAPFMNVASQPDTSIDSAIRLMDRAQEIASKNQGSIPQGLQLKDVWEIFDRLRPGEEVDRAMGNLSEKLERMEKDLAAEREERHRLEVKHAEEMATLRQQSLETRIKELSDKVDSGGKRDPIEEFKKTTATLKDLGLPIAIGSSEVGTKSPLEEANTLVKTVVESPGMTKIFDAASERVRTGAMSRTQQRPQPDPSGGLPPGQVVLCDNCLAQGKRTALPITQAVLAGKEAVTCPECGRSYWRGSPPPGPSSSRPGQPPDGPSGEGRPPFPGRF